MIEFGTLFIPFILVLFVFFILTLIRNSQKKEDPKRESIIITKKLIPKENEYLIQWKSSVKEDFTTMKTVSQLVLEKKIKQIRYSDLIRVSEWHLKRYEISIRDKFRCQDCLIINQTKLQVHHNYYLIDRLPWEIENEALVTLCQSHHRERHKDKIIPVYKKIGSILTEQKNDNKLCSRCYGIGYFPEFSHIMDGVCFKCNGDCFDKTIFSDRLNWVSSIDVSDELDKILNSVTSDYFESYIKSAETKQDPDDFPF